MVKERIIETTHGLIGEVIVETYDKFMKRRRDRGGWIDTESDSKGRHKSRART